MVLPVNQSFGGKSEMHQRNRLAGQSEIADELVGEFVSKETMGIRPHDNSIAEVAEASMTSNVVHDFRANPASGEAYCSIQELFRAHINRRVPLTDEEFAFVLSHVKVKRYKKHQFLIQEGQTVEYCYFVVSGLLKLFYTNESGRQYVISFAMEDWWESDFQAYFTRKKATLSLDCLEDTVVFCLSLEDYHTLCAGLRNFERFFHHLVLFGSMAAQGRILSLLTTQAKERYEHFLNQYPALVQRMPRTLLASYLGVTRETLSRLTP